MSLAGEEHGEQRPWPEVGRRGSDAGRVLRVLIVDDSPADANLLTQELCGAWTGIEACRVDRPGPLRDALAERWDVVLVDEDVPGLDAAEVIDAVRSTRPDVPCVAISAAAGEESAVAAMKRGASDYVTRQNLQRLPAVVRREVADAAARSRVRRARQALDLAEGRLEAVAAGLQDRLFAFDEAGRIMRVSGRPLALETAAGVRPVGQELWAVLAEPALERCVRGALAGRPAAHAWTIGEPGLERWFQAQLTPVRVRDEVVGGVAVVRDVSELKTLHARVAMSDRLVSIGSIAAGAAHDLCAPVASGLAALEEAARLARDRASALGEDGEVLLQALADARAACEQMRHVARDIRTFSRADERQDGHASADVTAVLDSSVRMAAHELRDRARVVRAYGAAPPARASVPRLGQVFLNLIVNAAQAIAPGAPDRNEVRLRTGTEGDRVVVEIEDTGCGMTPEVRRRLFTPFFTTKPEGVGTGLGLTICHRIVHELGGELAVSSEPGRGTCFRVVLPAAPQAAEPILAPAPADSAAEAARPRVLVVDDEETVHRAMGRLLGKRYQVACADASGALERLERGERFDLVLCDVSMPGISGLDLRRRVEALDAEQARRLAFLTGATFGAEAEECLAVPGVALVDKAAGPDELRASVEARLRAVTAR